jgi:hypothetical protein
MPINQTATMQAYDIDIKMQRQTITKAQNL